MEEQSHMLAFGYYNMDCNIGMKEFPDQYFDIAVVDPPYYSGPEKRLYYGRKESIVQRIYEPSAEWKLPDEAYFRELFRVSRHQIIFGVNYFSELFPSAGGRIVWDKCNGANSFSDCEIAYCSLHGSVRLFRYMWNGMLQGKSVREGWIQQGNKMKNEKRIHPTQKPVALYEWICQNYIEPGWKILDTHVGSASSLIAYHRNHLDYVGFEIDKKRYQESEKRLEEEKQQITLSDYMV